MDGEVPVSQEQALEAYHKEMEDLALQLGIAMQWSEEYIQFLGGTKNPESIFAHAEHQVSDYPTCVGAKTYGELASQRTSRTEYYNALLRQLRERSE